MPSSRDLPVDRLAIGRLLVRLLREFRAELFAPAAEHGYADMRQPHLHIFGNVGIDGVRLTDLAARAQLSLATTSELVSELENLGYLERRPDPADRRPKLISQRSAAITPSMMPATGSPRSSSTGPKSSERPASPTPVTPSKNSWTSCTARRTTPDTAPGQALPAPTNSAASSFAAIRAVVPDR
jgi:hypothetical protein